MTTRAEVAARIDHTLLAPEATADDVRRLCREAVELGVGAVCVSPTLVAAARRELPPSIGLCAVVGFPSGAHRPETKSTEADRAQADGATELDMVVDLGAAASNDWSAVAADVAAVRARTDLVLKVIVESALWPPAQLDALARNAVGAGADLLKTSTGFHPRGGATLEAVAALARVAAQAPPTRAGRPVGVKASGGIRDAATALAMLDAGATRLGCSASRAILDGLPADPHPDA
ncbi:MAG TPA: deoxyribose-phosphate aldolase [Acidimicrobiales bacterium]|nr:deoxyribose-phosphate aldolase [Acidimicrobiales bacterium]